MHEEQEQCSTCKKRKTVYGYCAETGNPYCEDCWDKHVRKCPACQEDNAE
jgi:hypothetical protein